MKYHVDSFQGEEFIKQMNSILNKMNEEVLVMQKIIEEPVWQGNAHDAFVLRYSETMKKMTKLPSNISLYMDFMNLVFNKYGEGNIEIKKKFKKIFNDINEKDLL